MSILVRGNLWLFFKTFYNMWLLVSVLFENGRILAGHTEGLFSVRAWVVNMRNTLCLYHHRCVFAGVVGIATSCSLKSI